MKTIYKCHKTATAKRERRAEVRRDVIGTLQCVGILVFVLLILSIEDWIEHII